MDKKETKKPSVDLIASGYGWDCPKCHGLNLISAIPKGGMLFGKVRCEGCRDIYLIGEIVHALD